MSRVMADQNTRLDEIKAAVGTYPDFPKKDILFRDIFGVLKNPVLTKDLVEELQLLIENNVLAKKQTLDAVIGMDARGFLLGPILALYFNCAFVPVRKAGKLPGDCYKVSYTLEYGSNAVEIQRNALKPGDRVLIFDDLLATGGSLRACVDLVRMAKAIPLSCIVVMELKELHGRAMVEADNVSVHSLIKY